MLLKKIKNYYQSISKEQLSSHAPLYLLGVVIFAQQAWVPGFFSDGYMYSSFAKNALEQGSWLTPHLSNSTYNEFTDHVPLLFILQGLFFKVVGISTTASRIFMSLFGLGTLFFLFKLLKRFGSERWAIYSGALFVFIPPLMKKVRFPNFDILLMFFILVSLYFYARAVFENNKKSWFFCGAFFGLAMLTKGPMAIFVPLTIFSHLIVTKNLKKLLTLTPWLGLLTGLLVFSIWPISLYLTGQFFSFEKWLMTTFVYSIAAGRGESSNTFFLYFIFLFKQCGPWMLLLLWGLAKARKDQFLKDSKLYLLLLCYFVPGIIFISIPTFKLSHYLIPFYPFLAALAAAPLVGLSDRFFRNFAGTFRLLPIILGLTLLIFPITTKIRRDKEVNHSLKLVDSLATKPNAWGISHGAYPFFQLVNIMSWRYNAETFVMSSEAIIQIMNGQQPTSFIDSEKKYHYPDFKWGFIMKKSDLKKIEGSHPKLFNQFFYKLTYYSKTHLALVVQRDLLDKSGFFLNFGLH